MFNIESNFGTQKGEEKYMYSWCETGFALDIFDIHLTKTQTESLQRLSHYLKETANNLDDLKVEEIRKFKTEGAWFNDRSYFHNNNVRSHVLGVLGFTYAAVTEELHKKPLGNGKLFNAFYLEVPRSLIELSKFWYFTLNLPFGKEFIKLALSYIADLLISDQRHVHELFSDYMPFEHVKENSRLYFAYGSNLSFEQMKVRCPSAEFVGLSNLRNFEFFIDDRGVASLRPSFGSNVRGVLWNIEDDKDWKNLDMYEGISSGFYKRLPVEASIHNKQIKSEVYISSNATSGRPRLGYQEKIIESVISLKSFYEKKYAAMGETFVEKGGDRSQLDFALNEWQTEMVSWLG